MTPAYCIATVWYDAERVIRGFFINWRRAIWRGHILSRMTRMT